MDLKDVMGVEGSELDHYLDVCTQMRVRREHFSLPQQDKAKSFKYALYTISDLTIPAFPQTLASRVQSLGKEDPLENGMATHSSILAWRIPWTVHGITKSP